MRDYAGINNDEIFRLPKNNVKCDVTTASL